MESDRGKPLAGKSTLNRLELTPAEGPKQQYKKIVADPAGMDELLVEVFLEAHPKAPEELILDLDATDDPLHGEAGRAILPRLLQTLLLPALYIFCGEHLLCARLRSSDRGAAHGALPELKRIVRRLREAWNQVRITVCGDSDFSKDELMLWCETEGVDYVFGLAQNPRLKRPIAAAMEAVRQRQQASGKAEREFQELRYQTLGTWTRERRVVAKVEHLPRGENPRFIVTSVPVQECAGRRLYEVVYCGRGEMENRIKEQQLGLFADRTSSRKLQANQLRLYFSSFAYVMLAAVAPVGAGGDGAGIRTVLDDPPESAEDRGPGPGHQPQGLVVLFRELSVRGVVEAGPGPIASLPASMLAREGDGPLEGGGAGLPRRCCARV